MGVAFIMTESGPVEDIDNIWHSMPEPPIAAKVGFSYHGVE
jgi:hypothetical protein